MPIYEYECKKCKHRFERIQKFSDKPIRKCPECGGRVTKLLSPPAVHFKGSGWYVTDYARKGSKEGESKDDKGTKEKEGKEAGKKTPSKETSSSSDKGKKSDK